MPKPVYEDPVFIGQVRDFGKRSRTTVFIVLQVNEKVVDQRLLVMIWRAAVHDLLMEVEQVFG